MLIEATRLKNLPVLDNGQNKLGLVNSLYFEGDKGSLVGLKVVNTGVLKKYYALGYLDCDISSQQVVSVENKEALKEDLVDYDALIKKFGKLLGVKAITQSGKSLGVIEDVLIEVESGLIVRMVLRNYVMERIIPRQFVVGITPKRIIFQDVVNQPTFDKLATGDLLEPATSN
jgi:sporulation protein YlmC with PRC-barrel domain